MARPIKNNIDYFPHDNGMRNDKKLLAVRNKFGHEGYSIYNMLLEAISEEDLLQISIEKIELLTGDFRIDSEKLSEIINYLSTPAINLIQIVSGFIRCKQLDKRANIVFSNRKKNLTELRVSGTETTHLPSFHSENPTRPVLSTPQSTQSKVKESKVKIYKRPESPDGGLLNQEQKNTEKIAFVINGQPVHGSFWQKIINYCHGDKYEAGRIFYRAKNADDIVRYIQAGLYGDDKYILKACSDEDNCPASVKAWMDENVFKIGPQKMNNILQEILSPN